MKLYFQITPGKLIAYPGIFLLQFFHFQVVTKTNTGFEPGNFFEKFLENHLTFSEIIYIIIIKRGNKNNKEEMKNDK